MKNSEAILHVDDDANDSELFALAFKRTGHPGRLICVKSGNEALRYLRGEGPYADRAKFPFPKYIISDLKMPDGDGLQLLQARRTEPQFCPLPVIIYSGSGDLDDIKKAYQLGAAAFFTKRHAMCEITHLAGVIYEFMDMGEHPERDEQGRLVPTISQGKLGQYILENPCVSCPPE